MARFLAAGWRRDLGRRVVVRGAIVDLDGTVLERFGSGDPSRPGSFYAPHGVAFDARGALYVTEVAYSGGARLDDLPDGWHTLQKLERAGS
jgi:hypothetical protein